MVITHTYITFQILHTYILLFAYWQVNKQEDLLKYLSSSTLFTIYLLSISNNEKMEQNNKNKNYFLNREKNTFIGKVETKTQSRC